MVFNGLPSIWILTKGTINPISHGKSERSLLDTSNVFNFLSFMISLESVLILLSASISTVKFGHRSKYEN